MSLAREWLQSCLTEHPTCSRNNERNFQLPKRLIFVGGEGDDPYIYQSGPGECGSWVSLSMYSIISPSPTSQGVGNLS